MAKGMKVTDGTEVPLHRPKRERPHVAQEVAELKGPWDACEYVRKLLPSMRHRAVGCKPYELPAHPALSTHISQPEDRGYYRG